MRVKITAETQKSVFIPFNYNYALHSAIYNLIEKSSREYSKYLHDKGFINEAENKRFKLFTFSKLFLKPFKIQKNGFANVKEINFIFSTPIEKSFEHLILGLFSDQTFFLNFSGEKIFFAITRVETLPQPTFTVTDEAEFCGNSTSAQSSQQALTSTCRFTCLSPIAVSTQRPRPDNTLEQHYLDYMNPEEREHFVENIRKNLINKYQTFYNKPYKSNAQEFKFSFDIDYITGKQGKISKLIHFKKIRNNSANFNNKRSNTNIRTKIKAFESPFTITADPKLINIGYDAGFGNDNSAGLGCGDKL